MVTFLTPLAQNSRESKGSRGPAFTVRIRTENPDQASICPFALREVSVLAELALGHLRYLLTDVPPQSNSPSDTVLDTRREKRRRKPETFSTADDRTPPDRSRYYSNNSIPRHATAEAAAAAETTTATTADGRRKKRGGSRENGTTGKYDHHRESEQRPSAPSNFAFLENSSVPDAHPPKAAKFIPDPQSRERRLNRKGGLKHAFPRIIELVEKR